MNTQQHLKTLKEDGLLCIRDKQHSWLCGDSRSLKAWEKAAEKTGKEHADVVLIGAPEQLREYVQQVPELAWDIMEFAEKALHLQLKHGHPLAADHLKNKEGAATLMLVNAEPLQGLLQKLQHGLFALCLEEEVQLQDIPVIELKTQQISPERRMRLGMDGEVQLDF